MSRGGMGVSVQEVAAELSEHIFGGTLVNIYLCDTESFKTLRVVTFAK